MHFDRSPIRCSSKKEKKASYDFKFGTFIGRFPNDGVGSVAIKSHFIVQELLIAQELCESRGGRPELSVLTSLLVSVDVKLLGDSAKLVC